MVVQVTGEWTSADGPKKQGPPGLDGADGEDGAVGPPGQTGAAGATGATGLMGPMGPPGQEGEEGAEGPVGPQGLTGATGPQGPAGSSSGGATIIIESDFSEDAPPMMPQFTPYNYGTSHLLAGSLPPGNTLTLARYAEIAQGVQFTLDSDSDLEIG